MKPDSSQNAAVPGSKGHARGARVGLAPWLLSLCVLAFYSPVVFAGRAFFLKDAQRVFYPTRVWLRQRLLALDLPAWLPQLDMGMPFLANPSNGVLYPLNVLLLLPPPYCVGLFIVVHALLAIYGSWLLLRELRLSPPASALGAVGFALGGYMVSMTWIANYMMSLAWLPLVGWLGLRTFRRGGYGDAALLALAWALQLLSGEPQGAVLTGVFLLALLLGSRGAGTTLAKRCLLLGAALALTLALAAPQVLPALEIIPRSRRASGIALAEAGHWSLHPLRLLELLAPSLFGSPLRFPEFLGYFMNDEGSALHRDPWMITPYLGSLSIVLAVGAVLRPPRRHRGWVRALAAVTLLAVLLALGRHTPIFGWYFHGFPLARLFRYPAKYWGLAAATLPFLAAAGLDAALSSEGRRRLTLWVAGLGLLLAGSSVLVPWGAACLQALRPELALPAVSHTLLTALLVESALLLLAAGTLWLCRRKPAVWALALVGMGALQIVRSSLGAYETVSSHAYDEPTLARRLLGATPPGEPTRLMHDVDSLSLPELDAAPAQVQADAFNAVLLKDIGLAYGLAYADSYISSEEGAKFAFWRSIGAYRRPMLDVFGVRHLVLPEEAQLPAESGLERLASTERLGAAVYENRSALPFAFPVGAIVPADGYPGVLQALRQPGVARGQFAIVERSEEVAAPLGQPGRVGDCHVTAPLTDRIQLECRLSRAGFVVVNESYHPGFSAWVDGALTPLVSANAFVMLLPVPAGLHRLTLEYVESSLRVGCLVSFLALAVCMLLLVRARGACLESSAP